jgi:hypothetical protein
VEPAVISLTGWVEPGDLSAEQGIIHITIPHGRGKRTIEVPVDLEQCLALCANAADAARYLSRAQRMRRVDAPEG